MEKSTNRRRRRVGGGLLAAIAILLFPSLTWASAGSGSGPSLGEILPLWSVIPFVGILLSIAIFPLVNGHWWEHNMGKASLFWGLAFFLPFAIGMGLETGIFNLLQVYVIDYIPFIVLLWGLFTISGGIIIRGTLVGTTYFNALILLIGSVLASIIGTTGASVLLIRPLIRANALRKFKAHTMIFFIFMTIYYWYTVVQHWDFWYCFL
jgi:Na+/H+ antiporter NhaD/arsenite permease-like protein